MIKKIVTLISAIIGGLGIGTIIGAKLIGKAYDNHFVVLEKNADKFADGYAVLIQWIKVHQKGKNLNDYFLKNNYKSVAVYGMNDIGYAIISEIQDTETKVKYCIDRNADNLFLEIDSYRPDEDLPDVDVCIIALPDLYKDISSSLKNKLSCPIVSIEDVVWEI